MANTPVRRCAIYTRKSSEAGLEQDYNSLHAQREACEAFIRSQAGEGWRLVKSTYDDGGYSGGTIERPALLASGSATKSPHPSARGCGWEV
jgi:site-specific DNA recombinase